MIYAQIDTNNRVVGVSQLEASVEQVNMILLESYDETLLGKYYDSNTGTFIELEFPEIVLTSITGTNIIYDTVTREVTLTAGTSINIVGDIKLNNSVVNISTNFRMSLKASDGREVVTLVTITAGHIDHTYTVEHSGIWSVTQESINSRLPENSKFKFSGLTIYSCT